jgi:hypothetical protein
MKNSEQKKRPNPATFYSEDFKRKIVSEYLESDLTKREILDKYDIKANSAIQEWMRKFGITDPYGKKDYIGLIPNTPGIDVIFSVTCLKKTDILQIIQTVVVNNDDKASKEDAAKDQIWISSDGKKIGFTDPGGTLFYYTKSQLPNFVKYDGKGGGTIRFIDNPSVLTGNPYSKTEFHSYIVIVSSDGKQQFLGRIQWSFTYKKADKTGMPSIITGGLTSTDLAIIKTDNKAYSELKIK